MLGSGRGGDGWTRIRGSILVEFRSVGDIGVDGVSSGDFDSTENLPIQSGWMFSWSGETTEKVCMKPRSFRGRSGSPSEYRETPKICSPACMARSPSGRASAFLCVSNIMLLACPRDSGLGYSWGGRRLYEARRGDNSWVARWVFIYSRPVRGMPGA